MFKLLLADDEKMTREGIRRSVEWQALGVSEVREAMDGLEALSLLEDYQPDIVLTDIKMPRMDGVDLAFQVRRKYPGCKIIFMSGYAEKEYLKAAISLKAISYVEKPIDMDELEEALQGAVQLCLQEKRHQEEEALAKMSLHASSSYIRQEICLQLTREIRDETVLRKRLQLAELDLPEQPSCASVMIKILPAPTPSAGELELWTREAAEAYGLSSLLGQKDELHTVLHLFAPADRPMDGHTLYAVCRLIAASLDSRGCRFSIGGGHAAAGLEGLPASYASAVAQLQETFYRGSSSVAVYPEKSSGFALQEHYHPEPQLQKTMQDLLVDGRFDEARDLLSRMAAEIRRRPGTLINSTKELYYRLLLELEKFAGERGLVLFQTEDEKDVPWELIFQCHYFEDVHGALLGKLGQLERALKERGGGSTASRIIRYIHHHYADETLTVQGISDQMQMTASHLIAVFKEATGSTVKQYLMEYRIERAKELLKTDSFKIFDIALQVGYRDGEYFAKIFRKLTGMTPSEYRERSRG
ncbi:MULTISPECIES: response regulator transcription factor [Paenibacillus]|uniref:response regulator transcription factor n=1 Tax=Paenibacillus TaxID=44249 RepID=UPI0022B92DED|nr:response regulator [Paenibacillus caseinilyticus]MCZ8520992.1 response regulator [Paenibacillus caseinilyticus]